MSRQQKLDPVEIQYFTVQEVADHLRKSLRWLSGILAEDGRRRPSEQRFQFHVRHGRTRLWTREARKSLSAAIARESEPGGVLAGSPRSTVAASGTYTAPSGLADAQSALDKVLAFQHGQSQKTPRLKNAAGSKAKSSRKRPAKKPQVLTFPSPQATT